MKLIIQRVASAQVTIQETGEVTGKIDKGLFVLLGVKEGDTKVYADQLAEKLVKLRILSDENDKMNLSILDTTKQILLVSQFTLYANTKDGNRPSFIEAAKPDQAREIYEYFIEKLKSLGCEVQIGSFGNYMKIEVELDGPVTISLES
jgi:D-tyrosyl-tRNA(Tyr) deacylase